MNNIVERDHRAVKQIARSMLDFNGLRCARAIIASVETMFMIRKGHMVCLEGTPTSAAKLLRSLAS